MARKRFVTSGMSVDKQLARIARVNPTAALMWPWFITALDDWGRMGADSEEINLEVFPAFPFTDEQIAEAISFFDKEKIVHYYVINGRPYIEANPETWFSIQSYIKKERKIKQLSKFPAPLDAPWTVIDNPQLSAINSDNLQIPVENVPSPSLSPSPSLTPIEIINNSSSEQKDSDVSKESIQGETKGDEKKKDLKIFPTDSTEYKLSALLRQHILENDPKARVPALSPETMARWCKEMDLLLRKDARAPDEVQRLIIWCQSDSFWKSNILSVSKFRDKYTTLKHQSERGPNNASSGRGSPGFNRQNTSSSSEKPQSRFAGLSTTVSHMQGSRVNTG